MNKFVVYWDLGGELYIPFCIVLYCIVQIEKERKEEVLLKLESAININYKV